MIAAVVQLSEQEEEKPPKPSELGGRSWEQFVPDPNAPSIPDSGSNVLSLHGLRQVKSRADFDDDTTYEIYRAYHKLDTDLSIEPVIEAAAAAGAETRDDSALLDIWLEQWIRPGYQSLIRTRPPGKRTSADYVMPEHLRGANVRCDAPERLKRVKVEVQTDKGTKSVHRNIPDVQKTELVEKRGCLLRYRPGKKDVTTVRHIPQYSGLCPLGKPEHLLAHFVPLRFSGPRELDRTEQRPGVNRMKFQHYLRDREKYLERQKFSQSQREKFGLSEDDWPDHRGVLYRRPPDVLWFLRNPEGKSEFYGDDEPWPHGIVDPGAKDHNDAMRHQLADVENSMRADGYDPFPVVEKLSGDQRRYANARPLKDPYFVELKWNNGYGGAYEGTENLDIRDDVISEYFFLKAAESGYRPDGGDQQLVSGSLGDIDEAEFENVEFLDDLPWGYKADADAVSDSKALVPVSEPREERVYQRLPDDTDAVSYLECRYREELGPRNDHDLEPLFLERDKQRNRKLSEVESNDEGKYQPVHVPWEENQRRKPGVRRVSIEITDDMWRTISEEPENIENFGRAARGLGDTVDVLVVGGLHRIHLDDPRYIPYLESEIEDCLENYEVLSNLLLLMKARHEWPEQAANDVNMDGLIDDAGVDLIVERVDEWGKPSFTNGKFAPGGVSYAQKRANFLGGSFKQLESKIAEVQRAAEVKSNRNRTPWNHIIKMRRLKAKRLARIEELRQLAKEKRLDREMRILDIRARRAERIKEIENEKLMRKCAAEKQARGHYWRMLNQVAPAAYAEYKLGKLAAANRRARKHTIIGSIKEKIKDFRTMRRVKKHARSYWKCRTYAIPKSGLEKYLTDEDDGQELGQELAHQQHAVKSHPRRGKNTSGERVVPTVTPTEELRVPGEPPEPAEELAMLRQELVRKGVDPLELATTDNALRAVMRRPWPRAVEHRARRTELVDQALRS